MTRRSNGFAPTVALIALLSFLSACASEPARPTPGRASEDGPKLAAVANGSQVGVASWYGGKFHGPSLPFGTKVRVTNLENGRSAVLRINDRGPFAKRRIIDVSRHAAEHLGFLKAGLAKVQVEVI
jgi:rare lipoprotein A